MKNSIPFIITSCVKFLLTRLLSRVNGSFFLTTGLFIILFTVTIHVEAGNRYISAAGNDSNNGLTPASAWKSMGKATAYLSDTALAGDSVLFRRGDVFFGSLIVKRSGTPGVPIVIGAYGTGAQPVLSGFVSLTGWTNVGGYKWECNTTALKNYVNIFTLNNMPYAVGRTPNDTFYKYSSSDTINSRLTTLTASALTGDFTGAEIVVRKNRYTGEKGTITSHTGNTVQYIPTRPIDNNSTAKAVPGVNNYGFFLQRYSGSLDKNGEWFFDTTTKKMKLFYNDDTSNIVIKASAVDTIIFLGSKTDITIQDIAVEGGNIYGIATAGNSNNVSNNITIKNVSFNNNTKAVYAWNSGNIVVQNCSFNNSFNGAILASNRQNNMGISIINNTINNTGQLMGMGLFWAGTNLKAVVARTDVADAGNMITITGNTIRNTGLAGIEFQGHNVLISRNVIDTFDNQLDDNGGIYTFVGNSSPNTFYYSNRIIDSNFIMNAVGAPLSANNSIDVAGYYLDDQSININGKNNTIFNIPGNGVQLNVTKRINFTDNTIYNCAVGVSVNKKKFANMDSNTLRRNVIYQKDSSQLNFYHANSNLSLPTAITIQQSLTNLWDTDSNWISNMKYKGYGYIYSTTGASFTPDSATTLAQWQGTYLHDVHSVLPPVTVTPTNTRLVYNTSSSPVTISLHDSVFVGVDGTLYNNSITLNPYSSKVLIFKQVCTLPAGWATSDIGTATPAGSACESGGIYTVQAAGSDIYGTNDSFRFTYIQVSGDNTVIAKVNSFSGTGAYPKAGVMLRESLNANSSNAFVYVRPNGNTNMQTRTTAGGSTSAASTSTLSFPCWVKITRVGTTVKGYVSTNGTTWTLKNTATISMTSSVYMGIAVSNYGNGDLSTAVFSNVSVQAGEVLRPVNTNASTDIPVRGLTIYPNPAKDVFTISINAPKTEQAIISITSLEGKVVLKQSQQLVKGTNKLIVDTRKHHLPHGEYIVRLQSVSGTFTSRIMIKK